MATLAPSPKLQFFDANGNPLVGGKLYTYAAGTTTPQVSYTDASGSTPNTNPIILDSRGEASLWMGSLTYNIRLTSAVDVDIWSVDNVGGYLNTATLAPAIHAATNKTTPVDADEFGIWDSVTGLLNRVSWANIKATLKTYFDTLYSAAAGIYAAKGANSDITSLSGLTTPLSVAQGGTAATTAATARSSLGAAASGTNTDITSITPATPGTINNMAVGGVTPLAGAFTTLTANAGISSTSATAAIGYTAGSGGTVTQLTSKSTGVTLNKPTGQIIMNNAALAANTSVTFQLTNSLIASLDIVDVVAADSVTTAGSYQVWASDARAGNCQITLRNITAGSLSNAVVLQFIIIKGTAS